MSGKEVWLHIDHIDNDDGDIWAVQVPEDKVYICAHKVYVGIPMTAVERQAEQPRAYLKGSGYVRKRNYRGKTTVTISSEPI